MEKEISHWQHWNRNFPDFVIHVILRKICRKICVLCCTCLKLYTVTPSVFLEVSVYLRNLYNWGCFLLHQNVNMIAWLKKYIPG